MWTSMVINDYAINTDPEEDVINIKIHDNELLIDDEEAADVEAEQNTDHAGASTGSH